MVQVQQRAGVQQEDDMQVVAVVRHARAYDDDAEHTIALTGETEISVPWERSRAVPLTRRGIEQIDICVADLAQYFPPNRPLTIIPGTYRRTRQTAVEFKASMIKQQARSPVDGRVSIAKPNRYLDTRHLGEFWKLTIKGIEDRYPAEYQRLVKQGPRYCPPGRGEDLHRVYWRAHTFVQEVVLPTTSDMVVVTHQVPLIFIWDELLSSGLPEEEIVDIANRSTSAEIPNTYAMVFGRKHTAAPWKIIGKVLPP